MPNAPNLAAPSKRRWYQYSLRTLFIVVTLVAIGLGLVVVPAERQRLAVQSLRRLGGDLTYSKSVEDETWFERLGERVLPYDYFDTVEYANFEPCPTFSDADAEWLTRLPRLETLVIRSAHVTDQGLATLKGLTKLRVLYLDTAQVTDEGLVQLQGLTQLQSLSLNRTLVTDRGLEYLKRLTQLRRIHLDKTQVTDAGLAQLREMRQLEEISLQSTRVTNVGVRELQEAFPKCEIYH